MVNRKETQESKATSDPSDRMGNRGKKVLKGQKAAKVLVASPVHWADRAKRANWECQAFPDIQV